MTDIMDDLKRNRLCIEPIEKIVDIDNPTETEYGEVIYPFRNPDYLNMYVSKKGLGDMEGEYISCYDIFTDVIIIHFSPDIDNSWLYDRLREVEYMYNSNQRSLATIIQWLWEESEKFICDKRKRCE